MRRAILTLALVVVGVLAVDTLGDLTQTRGDRIIPGSRSEVTLELRAQSYKHDLDAAADHLVGACAGATGSEVLADPGVERVERGVYRFQVRPSLGAENRRKLNGCLEDFTVDRLLAEVVSVERIRPRPRR